MIGQFAFIGDKGKATIAVAISLSVLLLVPASLGFGSGGTNIIIQEAFGQFNIPLLEGEEAEEDGGGIVVEEEEEEEVERTQTTAPTPSPPTADDDTTGTIQDLPTYILDDVNIDSVYGFIGSTLLPAQGVGGNATLTAAEDGMGHTFTGRFRLFANASLVERFVAEMDVTAIDGSSFHNITIEDGTAHRYEVTQGDGATNAATVPTVSSNIIGHIYINGGTTPVIEDVPMTLTARGQVLAIEDIDIDETRITDAGQRDILSIIDGETIYGTRPRR
jgi:hypothetical protein